MNTKELMIGDWVHVEAHCGFNAQNVKVETIPDSDSDNEHGHHYGHIGAWLEGGDNDFQDVETRHLQPIPLTAEILEKNGWRGKSNTQWKSFRFRDGCDKLSILLGKDYTMVEYLNVIYNPEDNAEVKYGHSLEFPRPIYVHELQHVLRLCGIDKTIEL